MRSLHATGLDRREADPGKRGAGSGSCFCYGWHHTGYRGSLSAHLALGHADGASYAHEHERGDLPGDSADENADPDPHAHQYLVVSDTHAFWRNADAAVATDGACFEPTADTYT